MTPHELARKIADTYRPPLKLANVTPIIECLAALGYTFVEPGTPGRYRDSEEERQGLRLFLVRKTGLHMQLARCVLTAIDRLHLMIREPDAHPSGLRTTEPAFSDIRQSGAQLAASRKPIDDRMPGQGRNYA
jgi:hypothetical protein